MICGILWFILGLVLLMMNLTSWGALVMKKNKQKKTRVKVWGQANGNKSKIE